MTIDRHIDVDRRSEELDDRTTPMPGINFDDPGQIPHDCEPETVPVDDSSSAGRLIGLDLARAVAVLGMIAVHLLPMAARDGTMSTAFVLSSGKASALFAVLAGVGLALSTGRTRRPTGRRWLSSMLEVAVRALLIGLLGLALGGIVPAERADVILVYYGVLFLLAIPLLRLRPVTLAVLAVVIAIAVPVFSQWWRAGMPPAPEMNLSFQTLSTQPVLTVQMLLLTGAFPALVWMAYVCAGLAIGRTAISERGRMTHLVIIGAIVAGLASVASWFVLVVLGGRDKLAALASQSMPLEDFTDLLVWGGSGTLPATSPWWLGVMAPHTGSPVDVLFTGGIAVAAIGVALILGLVIPQALKPIAAIGSMPLSLYTAHLLLLIVPFMPEDGWFSFGLHLLVLVTFALVWRAFFSRGPLEAALGWAAHSVGRLVGGRPRQGKESR